MYRYLERYKDSRGAHTIHIVEDWHAYVNDISEAPEWVNGDSTGRICHTCSLVIVD